MLTCKKPVSHGSVISHRSVNVSSVKSTRYTCNKDTIFCPETIITQNMYQVPEKRRGGKQNKRTGKLRKKEERKEKIMCEEERGEK